MPAASAAHSANPKAPDASASDDFDIAAESLAFEKLPLGDSTRQQKLWELARSMAAKDLKAALNWADKLEVPSERLAALSSIIASAASRDSAATMAQAIESLKINVNLVGLGSSDGALNLLVNKLLEVWPAERAFAWVDKNLEGEAKRSNIGVMIAELSRTNPEAALPRVNAMPTGPERTAALASLAAGWAGKDGAGALRFVESIADDHDRKTALDRLAHYWPYSDKAAVVAEIETLPEGPTRDALLGALASHIAQDSPTEAVRYADQIKGEARIAATRNLIRRWTDVDPTAASEHVAGIEDAAERTRLAGVLLKAWVVSEPSAASAWVTAYEGHGEAELATDFMGQWIHRDPKAASAWLTTLEEGSKRDAAVRVLIINQSSSDPEGALRWAETLSDPNARRENTSWLEKELEKSGR